MMSTAKPKPLIICGRHANIARAGREGLRPEYDCKFILFPLHCLLPMYALLLTHCPDIHVILSPEQGLHDLPFLKDGKAPPPFSLTAEDRQLDNSNFLPRSTAKTQEVEQVGSQDYSERAIAIILGGGFNDEAFEALRKSVDGSGTETGKWEVPWLRVDTKKTIGKPGLGKEYGLQIVSRAKEELARLEREGLMGKEGVYWF